MIALFRLWPPPYHRSFVERLSEVPASITELAAPTDVGLSAVLKHLSMLKEGGIVVSEKIGRVPSYWMQQDGCAQWRQADHAEVGIANHAKILHLTFAPCKLSRLQGMKGGAEILNCAPAGTGPISDVYRVDGKLGKQPPLGVEMRGTIVRAASCEIWPLWQL